MADDTREKFINPYTVLDNLDFLDETKVNWESEASQKEYWDYTSTLETAERKGEIKGIQQGLQQGVQQEKIETIHRLQAMGFSIEQIAQGTDMGIEEVKKLLQ